MMTLYKLRCVFMKKNKQFLKMEMYDLIKTTLIVILEDCKFSKKVNGKQSAVKSGLKTIMVPKIFADN